MLTTLISIFSSSIVGTLFGFVGNLITQWNDRKMMALKNAHELARMDKETEIMIKEAEAKIEVSREETKKATELANVDAYKTALEQEGKTLFKDEYMKYLMRPVDKWWYIFQWFRIFIGTLIAFAFAVLDVLKQGVRPSVTYYWVVITTMITLKLDHEVGGIASLTPAEKMELFKYVIHFILFECSTILSFWFCDRRNEKSRKEM